MKAPALLSLVLPPLVLLSLGITSLLAVEPRKAAQEYPAHSESAGADMGAEYLVHSYNAGGEMYFTKDYIVFEVGVFPKGPMELAASAFTLRINRAKTTLVQATPQGVALSLRHPDWNPGTSAEVGGGIGDTGVTIGGQRPTPRFPGDPTAGQRFPAPTRAPEDPNAPVKAKIDEPQLVLDNALQSGRITRPMAGYIYFPYAGNLKKLKNLSLVWRDGAVEREIPIL